MCGIIGELSEIPIDRERFDRMRDELNHRGPDGADTYVSDDGQVALGFRRLAIIDLTDDGIQPLPNEDETVYLLFNGEIYNYQTLREELIATGHEFRSETDSEVILHGYEEWGIDVLNRLRGMFAFSIWDETEERLFLARDRVGIKPLYYYATDDRFLFASEPKAILADDRIPREISPIGLRHYLRYRYIPAPHSIWEGMAELPQGHYLVYEDGSCEVSQYWDSADYLNEDNPGEGRAESQLFELLEDAVESHLVSDVPLGMLLSGGVDSGLVTALAARSTPGLEAFSMGFDSPDGDIEDETEHAGVVAEQFDVDLTVDHLSMPDIDNLMERVVYHYDEPLADNSIFPTFLLMQRVSEDLKVALAGDGGDELFAGYTWYDRYLLFRRFNRFSEAFSRLHRPVAWLADRTNNRILNAVEWRLGLAGLTGLEQYQTSMHPPPREEILAELLTDEYYTQSEEVPEQFAKERMGVKDVQLLDFNTFLPADILTKVDRASMANSLEVRVPLLDHHVAEYSFSLSEGLIFGNGEKKYLLKRVARRLLPESVVNRSKSGFGMPLDRFGFVERYQNVLEDSQAAEDGIFDTESLCSIAESDDQQLLFKLILFELWYRYWCTDARKGFQP